MIHQDECKNAYHEIANVTEGMICSGQKNEGTCQGDSGGPLQCLESNDDAQLRWSLYGLTSWAVGCAEEKYPSVAARVARYRDWIADNIAAN